MWLVSPGCADRDSELPAAFRRLDVPPGLLESSDARARGRALFLDNCALCHGSRGDGNGLRREGLVGRPRNFADAVWRDTTSARQVFYAIRKGRPGTSMPEWPTLSDRDAWDITAFVLSLGERP